MEIRKNLARNHSNSEWSLNELQDAILKEIHIFETGLHIVNQNSLIPTDTNAARNSRPTHNPSDGKKKHPCVYCSGSHAPSICDVVTDYQKQLEIYALTVLHTTRFHNVIQNIVAIAASKNITPAFVTVQTVTTGMLRNLTIQPH